LDSAQIKTTPKLNQKLEGVAILAPAAFVLLPAFALAFVAVEKDEIYEWTQHRFAGIAFAAAFLSVLSFGVWRKGWATLFAAVISLAALGLAVRHGLPDFHWLFPCSGLFVAIGYQLSFEQPERSLSESVAVGCGACLGFWACSRLGWQSFAETFVGWAPKLLFLGIAALFILLLKDVFGQRSQVVRPYYRSIQIIDCAVLIVLAIMVARTNSLTGLSDFPHHWGVYTVPAQLVREGHLMLGDVPAQYGFLSTLLLAVLPTTDRFAALFVVNSSLLWLSGAILYFALRSWTAQWWWKCLFGIMTVAGVAFICGDARFLAGPMRYPSVGATRFIWVYLLLAFLAWHHRGRDRVRESISDASIWLGGSIWLLGILWSFESAIYVTAVWFPAASILCATWNEKNDGLDGRIRHLVGGVMKMAFINGILFSTGLLIITGLYLCLAQRWPDWSGYWEYALSFSQGFGVLPIDATGGVWALLLLHGVLLASIVSIDFRRQRSSAAVISAAWGALWTVSTYFVSRSHPNNILNLYPILMMIVAVTVPAVQSLRPAPLAKAWIWLGIPPFLGVTLWMVFAYPKRLIQELSQYRFEPQTSKLIEPPTTDLTELVSECLRTKFGPITIVPLHRDYSPSIGPDADKSAWMPVNSIPLYDPLPLERRYYYLDIYTEHGRRAGWLIEPNSMPLWLYDYVNSRYLTEQAISHGQWKAWYLVSRPGR
jgi:hypothetical protein